MFKKVELDVRVRRLNQGNLLSKNACFHWPSLITDSGWFKSRLPAPLRPLPPVSPSNFSKGLCLSQPLSTGNASLKAEVFL
jgi:hypothetical protein